MQIYRQPSHPKTISTNSAQVRNTMLRTKVTLKMIIVQLRCYLVCKTSMAITMFNGSSKPVLSQKHRNRFRGRLLPIQPLTITKHKNQTRHTLIGLDGVRYLREVRPTWAVLWDSGNTKNFIDSVAAFQIAIGYQRRSIDGVLGPRTWARIRPIGEVIASQKVNLEKSKRICTLATQERLLRGYKRATGRSLVTQENRSQFSIILHTRVNQLHQVSEQYRGSGAAGGLVLLGVGEFVNQDDIWTRKALKPGAAMQVWKRTSDFERIKRGRHPDPGNIFRLLTLCRGRCDERTTF
ncbi:MAG: hypothetical protein R2873_06030 [Caldilineaceae bacterium]